MFTEWFLIVSLLLTPASLFIASSNRIDEPPVDSTPPGAPQSGTAERARRAAADAPAEKPDGESSDASLEGLWPSAKLTNLSLLRWTDEIAYHYDLGESQRAKLADAVVKRWTPFLQENRPALQPLVNEFLEMKLDLQPPSAQRVQAWAERALPLLDRVREQIDEATDDMRSLLSPLQRVKLELEAAQFGAGLELARQRLRDLQDGKFDPKVYREFWEPTASERQARRKAARSERKPFATASVGTEAGAAVSARKEPTDPVLGELSLWDDFVARFAQAYQLDEGQRGAAASCLAELKQRALSHRERHGVEMERLESRIRTFTGSEADLDRLKVELTELYGPIDDMFRELKDRLEKLPTAEQRAVAAAADGHTEKAPRGTTLQGGKTKPKEPSATTGEAERNGSTGQG